MPMDWSSERAEDWDLAGAGDIQHEKLIDIGQTGEGIGMSEPEPARRLRVRILVFRI